MTMRIVNGFKYPSIFLILLLSVIACEKDFENIGVGLVDNNEFSTKDTIFEVIAFNTNVDSSRVDALPQYLVGVYKDANFGQIKASFVGQLGIPSPVTYGDDITIDSVILDIPYYATRNVNNDNGTPNFELDSILGDAELTYDLAVYESGTFMNTLNPLDPTKRKTYYSNEDYIKKVLLGLTAFKPNPNDTVLYIKRRFLDENALTVDDIDTIKKDDLSPSIKIPLDETFFKNNFIDQQNSGVFESFDVFSEYFRGIIIEPQSEEGSIMTLAMADANITVYYSDLVLTDETETDLNGDGDTNDVNVPVYGKQSKVYPLSNLRTNAYYRNYSGSLVNDLVLNPNTTDGEDKLYIQGAAGTESIVELFRGVDLDEIRNKNWLINEANLTLYLDESSSTNVPERLFLYRYDQNSQLRDAFTEAQVNGIDGFLDRDDDNNPIKYEFTITDYISEVLKSEDPLSIERLAIKVFHSTDQPNFAVGADTIVRDFSWIAKGVVLKGNKLPITDAERFKLEIYYTINNE